MPKEVSDSPRIMRCAGTGTSRQKGTAQETQGQSLDVTNGADALWCLNAQPIAGTEDGQYPLEGEHPGDI